jgi:hypothetical protein
MSKRTLMRNEGVHGYRPHVRRGMLGPTGHSRTPRFPARRWQPSGAYGHRKGPNP